jgi:hypothetical protein
MSEDIIDMARQAGFNLSDHGRSASQVKRMMTNFAKLVAAREREACAKVCDDIDAEYEGEDVLATWCSKAIRARGGHDQTE